MAPARPHTNFVSSTLCPSQIRTIRRQTAVAFSSSYSSAYAHIARQRCLANAEAVRALNTHVSALPQARPVARWVTEQIAMRLCIARGHGGAMPIRKRTQVSCDEIKPTHEYFTSSAFRALHEDSEQERVHARSHAPRSRAHDPLHLRAPRRCQL